MAVLEARPSRREEGFNELRFTELAQKPQSVPSNVLVGVLQIVSNTIAVILSDSNSATIILLLTTPESSPASIYRLHRA